MAEWFKAAVLKTVDRKVRGFESLSLRHYSFETAILLIIRSQRPSPFSRISYSL
jgi:hypothetical protein